MKQSVWEETTIAVNAVGTISEVKEKWTNLQRTAKNELSKFRKEQRKTGGGPPPKMRETTLFIFENNRLSCDWQQVLFLTVVAPWHY